VRILALAAFDPASVVLSHRNILRARGHDFRLAVVRAYTERQRDADYVLNTLRRSPVTPGMWSYSWEAGTADLEELREFAQSADVIQFHPGIGLGNGDWASDTLQPWRSSRYEIDALERAFGLPCFGHDRKDTRIVHFFHGSNATRAKLEYYAQDLRDGVVAGAASTIDYAEDLGAAYLPPHIDVGDLRAPLRQDDDPLVIAHTPTDRVACSTEAFLEAARNVGAVVRLGEGISHKEVLALKVECNAGFDHLRGSFSVNTLENCALGLAPIFRLDDRYRERFDREVPASTSLLGFGNVVLSDVLDLLQSEPEYTRRLQMAARKWYETHFSAAKIGDRLLKFYEGL
jgi:hypothetical protein